MAKNPNSDKIYPWTSHGVSKNGKWASSETEYYTECPFCFAPNKFYINVAKKVHDCKVCGISGNYPSFLSKIHEINLQAIKEHHIAALAEDRGLPIDAFQNLGIGWNGRKFTIPVYNLDNQLVGLDLYLPGESIMHSPKPAEISLWNAPALKEHLHGPIILCEGQWDGIAMQWLMRELKIKVTVVAVPGANISIVPYEIYFYDKNVIVCYDNDAAGVNGEFKAYQVLHQKATDIHFIRWPESKSVGYDVRDLIAKWAVKEGNPKKANALIRKWLAPLPRHLVNEGLAKTAGGKLAPGQRAEDLKPINFQELLQYYGDYLYLPNEDPVRVLLGTVFANRFRSDMVWMFLVAPPSCGKSELILSLETCKEIEHISTVTERTFVSGYMMEGGKDASVFEMLRNRIMAIKDFTPILQMMPVARQAILGVLRDAYDGRVDAMYGHSHHKRFTDLHFGIIAGVTAEIENFSKMQQALGERFLRYYLPFSRKDQAAMTKKSEDNIGYEKQKRDKLRHAVHRFLETNKGMDVPLRTEGVRTQLRAIADFTVALRAIVPRDFKERVQYTPVKEGPMRVCKQLSLLGMGLASLEKKEKIGEEEIRLIKKISLSTCPDIVRSTVKALHDSQLPMSSKDLEDVTGFPINTLRFVFDDLKMLGVIEQYGRQLKSVIQLSDHAKDLIRLSDIYEAPKKKVFFIGPKKKELALSN